MKYLIILLLFCSCLNKAQEKTISGDFELQFLFEKNGCKMYRFNDGGDWIYWSDCEGRTQNDDYIQQGETQIHYHQETITNK